MLVCQDNEWSVLHWWLHQPENLFFFPHKPSPSYHSPAAIFVYYISPYTGGELGSLLLFWCHCWRPTFRDRCAAFPEPGRECILWRSTSRSSSLRGRRWTQFPCGCLVWKDMIALCRMRQILSFSVEPVPWRTLHDGHSRYRSCCHGHDQERPWWGSSLKLRHTKHGIKTSVVSHDVQRKVGWAGPGCWAATTAACTKIRKITISSRKLMDRKNESVHAASASERCLDICSPLAECISLLFCIWFHRVRNQ